MQLCEKGLLNKSTSSVLASFTCSRTAHTLIAKKMAAILLNEPFRRLSVFFEPLAASCMRNSAWENENFELCTIQHSQIGFFDKIIVGEVGCIGRLKKMGKVCCCE